MINRFCASHLARGLLRWSAVPWHLSVSSFRGRGVKKVANGHFSPFGKRLCAVVWRPASRQQTGSTSACNTSTDHHREWNGPHTVPWTVVHIPRNVTRSFTSPETYIHTERHRPPEASRMLTFPSKLCFQSFNLIIKKRTSTIPPLKRSSVFPTCCLGHGPSEETNNGTRQPGRQVPWEGSHWEGSSSSFL